MNKYSIISNTYSLLEKKMTDFANVELPKEKLAYVIAGLGALGTALQNYQAVALTLADLTASTLPASQALNWSIQIVAVGAGAICSGLVNFWVNIELLEDFFGRFKSQAPNEDYENLDFWEKIVYWGGIGVFVITGLLFGAMAFTFAATGPFFYLSIAVGLFVAAIMTIQEVETWLSSYGKPKAEAPLSNAQFIGKCIGHLIAAINVIALSLLFALSLGQALMILNVAAGPALIAGFAVAFTFGAFTEFFFYNGFLSKCCQDFVDNIKELAKAKTAILDFFTLSVNALVNTALTYAGIEILIGVLIAANVALPPVALLTASIIVLSLFAGAASFILGLDFKNRNNKKACEATKAAASNDEDTIKPEEEQLKAKDEASKSSSLGGSVFSLFAQSSKATDVETKTSNDHSINTKSA